jgi:hypothetical protein
MFLAAEARHVKDFVGKFFGGAGVDADRQDDCHPGGWAIEYDGMLPKRMIQNQFPLFGGRAS